MRKRSTPRAPLPVIGPADDPYSLYHQMRPYLEWMRVRNYSEGIVSYCESLRTFPYRGHRRDDIRPGLRITNYKKRTVIAFAVEAELVAIIGVFYGGQDYEAILRDDEDREQSVED